MARRVAIVPHTHWDREWYSPFQTFRLRLVDLLDDLLPRLEADPSFAHFMLDGQMAVVDDYLAVRPEAEPVLRRLAASGRLSVGPWYALPDEFLVSGETLIRNLQLGLARAAAYGGAMEVGYLPDMFGHVAQMPQLFRQLGFEHAVVWRGVPAAVDRTGFWWSAPDGSTVRAEYLPEGYGNGAAIPDDAKELVASVVAFEDDHGEVLTGPILWMNGADHLEPQPWLGRVVAEANAVQDDYVLEITSLPSYLAAAPADDLPAWTGELRSGSRANVLMGVASNRVDVKQAAARTERALERLAEPLSALFLPAERWPAAPLDLAWLEVVRNSAHDSICACSHDEVGLAVLHRYAEARAIAEGLAERAVAALAATIDAPRHTPVVVNPSPRSRSGLVELRLPGDGPIPDGTQLVAERSADFVVGEFASAESAATVVHAMQSWRSISDATVEPSDDDGRVRVRATRTPARWMLARVDDVPGYGWRALVNGPPPRSVTRVVGGVDSRSLTNGLVSVAVDPTDGTYSIDNLRRLGRLVDGGDVGDTYNWCPPAGDVEVDAPEPGTVNVLVAESGPLRGRLEIAAKYRWRDTPTEVRTTLELRAGERLVRVTHAFVNRVRDHRLRAWFPLPAPATSSRAECAFAVVERGLTAEGGLTELGLPTFPSRRFVQAGGLTVVHEGLLEYELVDIQGDAAHALALTLLRCTGLLSQGPMATRPLPAGPLDPAEAAQMQGPVEMRYALAVGDDVDPYALVDDAFLPMLVTKAAGSGALPPEGSALTITGAEASAVRRSSVGGPLEIRVFNPNSEPTTVTVAGHHGWLVDLRSRPIVRFEESFELGPWAVATAVLNPRQ